MKSRNVGLSSMLFIAWLFAAQQMSAQSQQDTTKQQKEKSTLVRLLKEMDLNLYLKGNIAPLAIERTYFTIPNVLKPDEELMTGIGNDFGLGFSTRTVTSMGDFRTNFSYQNLRGMLQETHDVSYSSLDGKISTLYNVGDVLIGPVTRLYKKNVKVNSPEKINYSNFEAYAGIMISSQFLEEAGVSFEVYAFGPKNLAFIESHVNIAKGYKFAFGYEDRRSDNRYNHASEGRIYVSLGKSIPCADFNLTMNGFRQNLEDNPVSVSNSSIKVLRYLGFGFDIKLNVPHLVAGFKK